MSVPCLEIFLEQDPAYRDAVLLNAAAALVIAEKAADLREGVAIAAEQVSHGSQSILYYADSGYGGLVKSVDQPPPRKYSVTPAHHSVASRHLAASAGVTFHQGLMTGFPSISC